MAVHRVGPAGRSPIRRLETTEVLVLALAFLAAATLHRRDRVGAGKRGTRRMLASLTAAAVAAAVRL